VSRSASRSPVRAIAIGVCALVIAGLFGAVVRQTWSDTDAALKVVTAEYDGATVMHKMTTLLSELVGAQSTAVRGDRVDPEPLRTALAKVTEDPDDGRPAQTDLQIDQRLKDLRSQVESAIAKGETGRAAYTTYSGLVSLTIELIRRIGDTSHLVHDPDLDSYYLMDAAIIRLPDAVVLAGRATDLVTLAGGKTLTGEDQVAAGVARFGVANDAEAVSAGLTKSVDTTNKQDLGSNVAERLDTFKAAADAFSPPTMLAELATTVDAATLAANARRVYSAAASLAHLLLSELQALLDTRAAKLQAQQRFTLGAAAGGVIIALAISWLGIAGRPRRGPSRRFGSTVDDPPVGSLAYARDLLESNTGDLTAAAAGARGAHARTRGNGNAL
jgi:hypothetical protein